MRGVIYGDVEGSVYEWVPVEKQAEVKDPLRFTDDTVLNAAVTDALLTCRDENITDDAGILRMLTKKLQEYGRRYPDAGYSRTFRAWIASDDPKPYGSKTNGALMRCTSAGWLARSPREACRLGRLSAMPTHDHPEATDAAALTAEIIFRLRMGESVEKMYKMVAEKYKIPSVESIRPITEFDFTCKTTLPIAFAVFYESCKAGKMGSEQVKEVVETAISLGGDTDTNAAVAAAFAEACNFAQIHHWRDPSGKDHVHGSWYAYFGWESDRWLEVKQLCTPDILSVVERLDKAVDEICPLRQSGEYSYRVNQRGEAVIVHCDKTKEPSLLRDGRQIYGKAEENTIKVPDNLDGFPVTAIGPFAFTGHRTEEWYIEIPEGVRTIGDHAFEGVKERVVLPDSVESIGLNAFAWSEGVWNCQPKHREMGPTAFAHTPEERQRELFEKLRKQREEHPVSEEQRRRWDEETRRRREVEAEMYEYREVSVQRYAGWREHAEESGYYIDGNDRVFERVPKNK